MTDLHIRGLDDPDVRLEGMPATQKLWTSEDPYDLEGTEETFLEAVRENLRHHQACPFYADWLERNGFSPDDLRTMDDIVRIPPVPAEFYKTHVVKTVSDDDIVLTLTASGTSGQKSQMFFDEWSIFASDKSADVQMRHYGRITDGPVNFLMYSYEPAEGVNAGTLRTRQMMRRYGRENELVYALRWTGSGHEFDMFGCIRALRRFEEQGLPVYILGFPAFLYFTLEKMEAMGFPKLKLNPASFVSMGGGWKGFADRQVSAEEFRRYASERLGLPDRCFHETYGAVEHGVAYVDCDEHHFHIPVYDRVIIRDPATLEPLGYDRKGILNFVSPMNTAVPVTSLMMGDFAIMHPPGSCRCGNPAPWIEIAGRAGVKANRSCAIAAAELLRRR